MSKCMKMKSSVLATMLVAGTFSAASFAVVPSLQVQGAMPVQLKLNNGKTKIIRLMNISLSSEAIKKITHTLNTPLPHGMVMGVSVPAKSYVGMNGQPVLDQGQWGSCATFSSTAAVNATYNLLGEARVSQLCNLQVGRTIDALPGSDGGWQGSFGYLVLGQINKYGFMNLDSQHKVGCGGLKEYPTYGGDNGQPMSIENFTSMHQMTFTANDWAPIVKYDGNFEPLNPDKAAAALKNVKLALRKGYRVVFGSILDPYVGQAGAVGEYKDISQDTWVMTDKIKHDIALGAMAGHEIIIDGYDDNACATYTDSKWKTQKQCGLLRIRNSWGPLAGYKGDYFMSYDHFKGMAIEVYAVGKDVKENFKSVK